VAADDADAAGGRSGTAAAARGEGAGDAESEEVDAAFRAEYEAAAQTWRAGPGWANLEIQLADELEEIEALASRRRGRAVRPGEGGGSEDGGGREEGGGRQSLDRFVVERASEFVDQSCSEMWSSPLRGALPLGPGFEPAQVGLVDCGLRVEDLACRG